MLKAREEPFFFDHEGARLFALLHVPDSGSPGQAPSRRAGMVFCHPFAEEKGLSHRVIVAFARFMCDQGYHVLRFDCRGYGDSEGEFEQVTVKTQLSDIGRAMEVLSALTGVTNPVLFGLRFGATLAALCADTNPKVKALVLWEPIVQVKAYFLQFLRMQVVADKLRDGKVTKTREQLIGDLKAGRCIDVFSFLICSGLFEECMALDMVTRAKSYQGPMLVVCMSRSASYLSDLHLFMDSYQGEKRDLKVSRVEDRQFWLDPNNVYRELASWCDHEKLFQWTFGWLEDRR